VLTKPMFAGAMAALCNTAPLAAQLPQYQVSDSIIVGPTGGDFYTVDAVHHRLYGAGPQIVDIDAKRVVGSVGDTTAGGGFVIAPELGIGLVRNGTLFTLSSGAVLSRVHARGDASLYDPATHRAFLLSDTVSVIDMKTGGLVAHISVPGAGESGVADGGGRVYFNLALKDSIAVLNARTLKLVAKYSVSPAKTPTGLAIDVRHNRLFVACLQQVAVLDAVTGKMVTIITVPGGISDQFAFDPGTGLLFEPGGQGVLTIIHEDGPDEYSIVQTLRGPLFNINKIVVDSVKHVAYVPHRTAENAFSYLVLEPVR
jgi:DNA-binding beta-propeller fold protein YncE